MSGRVRPEQGEQPDRWSRRESGPWTPVAASLREGLWPFRVLPPGGVPNRARTGVSPALPWNALGCVGARVTSGPALRTHFGWRLAAGSELARTRGIRLSN